MEDFTLESPPPLAVCQDKIDSCGAVVLLLAHRYGSRPPGETLGYTELEYEYAVQCGKQLHIFRVEESFPWPPTDVDRGDDAVALARFGKRVGVHTIGRFGDLARFREDLVLALRPYAMARPGHSDLREAGTVRWPLQVGSIPLLADCYQHRQRETGLISDALAHGATTVLTQVLSGLGGVGKTQLAAAYAHAAWRDATVELLMWVTASSREAIQASYAHAASQIAITVPTEAERSAAWLLGWLQTTHRPWLIVLDDLSDPADLQGLWPVGPAGHCLVTTRRRDAVLAGSGRQIIDLGLYTPQEALTYLRDKLPAEDDRDDGQRDREMGALAQDLDYLPLALAQAASFILDRQETVAGYRHRFHDRRRRLGQLFPADALADDYRFTVAATWAMSVQRADQLAPVGIASAVLELVSVLDPNGAPLEVATAPAALRFITTHQRGRDSPSPVEDVDERDCRDALANLHRLNLVSVDPTGRARAIRTHALVQRATLEHQTPEVIPKAVAAAADALVQVWPDIERDTELGRALRDNATRLANRYPQLLWGHSVLFRVGHSLGECGLINTAAAHWESMVAKASETLGPDHPYTLTTRHSLAYWRGKAGDPAGAATAFEQLLADCLRVLGSDHPNTLVTRSDLARWRGEAGDPAGAATATEQLLADFLRVLGPDHPDTLATRHNLARWRGEAGDPAGAV
ncbi:MAG: tetratricopeptide repeat protein, partial [Pseudonocardiaceae bacterium]